VNLQDFWNEALFQLESEVDSSEFAFYFSSLEFLSSTPEQITLSVPSAIFRSKLEKTYLAQIQAKLKELTGKTITCAFVLREAAARPESKPAVTPEQPRSAPPRGSKKPHFQLNPDYTLENYVVGNNNQLAYSMAVFFVSLGLFAFRWRKLERGFGSMVIGLLGGTIFIWVAAGAYQLGWVPGNIDLTPLGLTLTALVYYLVLWPSRLYEMVPLSREVLFHSLPEPVVVTDRKARLVDWNAAAVGLFPALETAHTGWPLSRVVVDRAWLETLSDPQFSQAVTLDRGGVTPGWWSITPSPVRDSQGRIRGGVIVFRDVSAPVARHEIHEPLDPTDLVTGLFQETTFRLRATTQVTRSVRRGEPVALVLLAFPSLEKVRQSWGEGVVSSWRQQLVHQVLPLLRAQDLMGSLDDGGFAVLMPGLTAVKARTLAEKLLTGLRSAGLHLDGLPASLEVFACVAAAGRNQASRFDDLWREANAELVQRLEEPARNP